MITLDRCYECGHVEHDRTLTGEMCVKGICEDPPLICGCRNHRKRKALRDADAMKAHAPFLTELEFT